MATWITEDWLRQKVVSYRAADDVSCDAFMKGVRFTNATKKSKISPEASEYMKSLGNIWVEMTTAAPSPGPYLVLGGQLFRVYRLNDDTQGASVTGILPSNDWQYDDLNLGGETLQTIGVAVPSRLRQPASEKAPFAGLRVVVKDKFAIQGIRKFVPTMSLTEQQLRQQGASNSCVNVVLSLLGLRS
ncbi:MAG: hypothetical protein Q9188_003326 [Gyalolechia gomerana]